MKKNEEDKNKRKKEKKKEKKKERKKQRKTSQAPLCDRSEFSLAWIHKKGICNGRPFYEYAYVPNALTQVTTMVQGLSTHK